MAWPMHTTSVAAPLGRCAGLTGTEGLVEDPVSGTSHDRSGWGAAQD